MASDTGFFLERRPRIDEAPPRPQRAWFLTVVRLECRLPPAENTLIRLSNTSVEVQLPLGVSWGHPRGLPHATTSRHVAVGVPMGAHLLRRLDAVASDLGMDRPEAIHTALLHWLEQEERKTAVRNRMLTIRALTKPEAHTA